MKVKQSDDKSYGQAGEQAAAVQPCDRGGEAVVSCGVSKERFSRHVGMPDHESLSSGGPPGTLPGHSRDTPGTIPAHSRVGFSRTQTKTQHVCGNIKMSATK